MSEHFVNKRELFQSLFHTHIPGAVCNLNKNSNALSEPLTLSNGTYYRSDECNSDCSFDCVRHVPSSWERRDLYAKKLSDLLLYKCEPIPFWIVLTCLAVLLITFIIVSVPVRRFISKKMYGKPQDPITSQSQQAQKGWKGVNVSERNRDETETTAKQIEKGSNESVRDDESVKYSMSAESLKSKKKNSMSRKGAKLSKQVIQGSFEPVSKKKESKVRANTWIVEQVSEDQ